MGQPSEHVNHAVLSSAASEPNAEAFRRAIRASNSKIDAELMIGVFRSLGNAHESNLRKRRGVSRPGEVSVDAVVAEYAKGMLERNRTRTRRTLADYVELGAGLTSEMLDAEKMKKEEEEALEKGRHEGAFSLVKKWRRLVESEEMVTIYPFPGKVPPFVAFYSAIIVGIILMLAWKTISDQYDETRFYEGEK